MKSVQIIQVGGGDPIISLKLVRRIASMVQCYYNFHVGDAITNLGNPMDDGLYSIKTLLNVLIDNRHSNEVSITVGITHCKLQYEMMSAVDPDNKAILITTDPDTIKEFIEDVKSNPTAYVLFELGAQLLTIDYRRRTNLKVDSEECDLPWHPQPKGCVFDYCDNPRDTRMKLIKPNICDECTSYLESANVGGSAISACEKIIKISQELTTLSKLKSSAFNPIIMLFVGAILATVLNNWLMITFSPWLIICILIVVILSTLFILIYIK